MEENIHPIIKKWIDNNFPTMSWDKIPNNKIWLTDCTTSRLVWIEENITIEQYHFFPNTKVPMHSHPFDNHIVFLGGDFTAYREMPNGSIRTVVMQDWQINKLSTVCPQGCKHGFDVGPRGASMYNIQIDNENSNDRVSAVVKYIGSDMGPIHRSLMET
jgi:hypothetical protein